MAILAEVKLQMSGRSFLTELPHHPDKSPYMSVRDGDQARMIRVTKMLADASKGGRGIMLVEADEFDAA